MTMMRGGCWWQREREKQQRINRKIFQCSWVKISLYPQEVLCCVSWLMDGKPTRSVREGRVKWWVLIQFGVQIDTNKRPMIRGKVNSRRLETQTPNCRLDTDKHSPDYRREEEREENWTSRNRRGESIEEGQSRHEKMKEQTAIPSIEKNSLFSLLFVYVGVSWCKEEHGISRREGRSIAKAPAVRLVDAADFHFGSELGDWRLDEGSWRSRVGARTRVRYSAIASPLGMWRQMRSQTNNEIDTHTNNILGVLNTRGRERLLPLSDTWWCQFRSKTSENSPWVRFWFQRNTSDT